ncbi:MAG TPA: ExeM/NucH family extracellular endonuclease [Candidatus Deferrimicrobium sp.]|nr:ExeM/NucH family extracellular endonuclease [Candidatus Deferrimicrobium sp.]
MRLGRARRPLLSMLGSLLILTGLLPAIAATPVLAVSPDLVISQVYGAGGNSGALYQNDYVELYNRGAAAVDLDPYSIQYASATGTGNFGSSATQPTELPPYVLNPGAYILIIEAGGINGSPMPNPNITDGDPISMAAGAGKVALVTGDASLGCNGGSTPCSATALARIVDLVGYGTANFFEGAGPAPAISMTLADFRAGNGATDTDNNAADFTAATPNPRTTGDLAPSVTSTTPADGASSVALSANISITFSEPVTTSGTWFTIGCTISGVHTAVASGGTTTFTIDPDADFVAGDSCTVTIVAANVTDNDVNDPPDTMAANFVFSFSTGDPCALSYTHAYEIQGSGPNAAITGAVTTQGVVVADDEGASPALRGFFLQDLTGDGNAATSDAVFVFNGNRNDVSLGDIVRVTGTASDFQDQTQVSASSVRECGTGSVDPTPITLPQPSTDYFERYEGMLVEMTQTLTVTEHFQLGRFGQVVVSSGGRQMTPTAVAEPGAPAQAVAAANLLNRVIVDDPTQDQNHDPILFGRFGNPLSASNTLRIGDTMTDTTGVLTYTWAGNSASGNAWRLRPVEALGGGVPDFQPTNPRPAAPVVDGSVHVAAMNVLNYFTTLDSNPGSGNGPDICGPTGGQECRGANTAFELDRQRTKLVHVMAGLHADVIGLMELQNDADVSIADLVDALRTETGNPAWDFIHTGTIGTDAIKVGIAYDGSRVTPVGAYAILDSSVDPRFIDTKNRPSLAQTFDQVDGGGRLTVVVNHLKSKGSDCNDIGDPDTGDGSGNCNLTRTAAAEALVDWIATDPTHSGDRDVLVVGDMNAYAKEAPIDVFVNAGFQNVIERYAGADAYSYVFDGQTGYLDHALASPTLAAQLAGAAEWHNNADEPAVLDYNTDFKSAAQITDLYAPDAYRASDHDPLVVGLNLLHYAFSGYQAPVDNPPVINATRPGASVPVKFSLGGDRGLDVLFRQPTSTGYTCQSGAPVDTLETEAAGGSGLQYDPLTDTYTYVWKTLKAWSGTCRELDLTFRDGTFRTADFAFRG